MSATVELVLGAEWIAVDVTCAVGVVTDAVVGETVPGEVVGLDEQAVIAASVPTTSSDI
ncbi:MAG: hypothetical protein ABIR68_07730 [Ilumatobacteraceae bacterium]